MAAAVLASAKEEVPLDGSLEASALRPGAGETVVLRFEVVPRLGVERLRLRIALPDGLVPISPAATEADFDDVAAGRVVGLELRVEVRTAAPRRVLATATLAEGDRLKLERSFVLDLNAADAAPSPLPREGTDRRGRPLVIFESGR